jgi:hypothetical protein
MAIFASIENNLVTNVIIADNIEWINENLEGKWVEVTEETRPAGIGWSYNSMRNLFLCPEPVGQLGFDEEKYDWITPPWTPPVRG